MVRLSIWILIMLIGADAFAQKDLNVYLESGIRNSPLLKDYQNQIASNKIDSMRLSASFLPQVSGSTAGVYAPIIQKWGYDEALTNHHTYNAFITVSKNFIGRENLANQYGSLQIQNQVLGNQQKLTEQDLKKTITQQYIIAYGDLQQINYINDMLTLLREEEIILKKLTEKGIYKQTDYLAFLVTLQQQELQLRQVQLQYQNDFALLNYLSGTFDTSFTILHAPQLTLDLPPLEQTVFYRQYEIDSLKLTISDKQIDFGYRPKLSIFADGGYNSSFALTPYRNFGVSTGVSLTVPIYDGGQRRMQHDKIKLQQETRAAYRDFFSAQYHQQIAQLKQQISQTEQLIEQTSTQLKYAEGLITAQRRQLITGDIRIADYIIAISSYLSAKNTLTQNSIARFQLLNQLNYWNRKL